MTGRVWGRAWLGVVGLALWPLLSGCGDFFVPVNNIGGGSGGSGGTGSRIAYVLNQTSGTIAGFGITTAGALTTLPNSPYSLPFLPLAAVVSRANTFLYVAGPGTINAYTIASDGSLTAPTTGATVAIVNAVSLDVSPDGNWLLALEGVQQVVDVYKINTTTGGLTLTTSAAYTVTGTPVVPTQLRVAPNGNFVFAALGTAGDVVFTFNTSTGALLSSQALSLGTAGKTSDNALAIDSTTSKLYIARSGINGGLAVYTVGSGGALNAITGSPFASGNGAYSVAFDGTGGFVYVANRQDNTVSGYAIGTTGVLTPVTGSPYVSGTSVSSLGVDSTGKFMVAASFGGSPDVTLYGFDATTAGKLNNLTTAASGVDPAGAVAVAMTH